MRARPRAVLNPIHSTLSSEGNDLETVNPLHLHPVNFGPSSSSSSSSSSSNSSRNSSLSTAESDRTFLTHSSQNPTADTIVGSFVGPELTVDAMVQIMNFYMGPIARNIMAIQKDLETITGRITHLENLVVPILVMSEDSIQNKSGIHIAKKFLAEFEFFPTPTEIAQKAIQESLLTQELQNSGNTDVFTKFVTKKLGSLRNELKRLILSSIQQTTEFVYQKWQKKMDVANPPGLTLPLNAKISNLRLHIALDALGKTVDSDWKSYEQSFNSGTEAELPDCLARLAEESVEVISKGLHLEPKKRPRTEGSEQNEDQA